MTDGRTDKWPSYNHLIPLRRSINTLEITALELKECAIYSFIFCIMQRHLLANEGSFIYKLLNVEDVQYST